jgi:hypothetical protein
MGLLVLGLMLFSTVVAVGDPMTVNGTPVALSVAFAAPEAPCAEIEEADHAEPARPPWSPRLRRAIGGTWCMRSPWLRHVLRIRGP